VAVRQARDAVRAVAVEREIVAGGGRAVPVGGDFHDADAVRAMVVRAQDVLGLIDIAVNNVGREETTGGDPFEHGWDAFGQIFDLQMLADRSNAKLIGANLFATTLSGAKLYGANLSYPDLHSAKLNLAKLPGANLTREPVQGGHGRIQRPSGPRRVTAQLTGPGNWPQVSKSGHLNRPQSSHL
jgi:NAD(P)-dependent dehydrogenase (short-subunit alcohol dehydrogenase family)